MKSIKYGIMLLAAFASFSSCDEHDFLKEETSGFLFAGEFHGDKRSFPIIIKLPV